MSAASLATLASLTGGATSADGAAPDEIGPPEPTELSAGTELPAEVERAEPARFESVDHQYIVTFRSRASQARALGAMVRDGLDLVSAHDGVRPWVVVEADEADVDALAADPDVLAVEPNGIVRLSWAEPRPAHAPLSAPATTQEDPPWGLDRIDQRDLPLDDEYTPPASGSAVRVYVIDDGIFRPHADFGGRAAAGAFLDPYFSTSSHPQCSVHGSHVAGTIGGALSGVAKAVELVPVRVFDCLGRSDFAAVMSAMDWVLTNHPAETPGVVNMSFGGPNSPSMNRKVAELDAAGLVVVAAAGNESADACESSPANSAKSITVASSTKSDERSTFSNTGPCVDLFAPGSAIESVFARCSSTSFGTASGTSMAAPHVAGVAAALLSRDPGLSPADVRARLSADATTGPITDPGPDTPNLLLYVSDIALVGSDPAPAAQVSLLPIPANSMFATAASLPATGGTVTGTNEHAGCEPNEPRHAGQIAGASVWWRFTAVADGTMTLSTEGSTRSSGQTLDTVLAVYTGTSVGSLTPVVSNDDVSDGVPTSEVSFGVVAGTTYSVAVDGFDAMPGSITLDATWIDSSEVAPSPGTVADAGGEPLPESEPEPTAEPTAEPATEPATEPAPEPESAAEPESAPESVSAETTFVGLVPDRLLDTRGAGGLVAGGVVEVPVWGRGGVPVGAGAVVLNVTVVGASGAGFASVFPCEGSGDVPPDASNLNFVAGQTVPNSVVSKVGSSGSVCVFSSAPVDVLVDVSGVFDR